MNENSEGVAYRELDFMGGWGYRVGSDGSVWGRRKSGPGKKLYTDWRQLSLKTMWTGHLLANINRKWQRVHRLVLLAFVGECPPGHECRHLDDNPKNNNLSNLCWGTRQDNRTDMVRNGKSAKGEATNKAKVNVEQVRSIRLLHNAGDTLQTLSRQFGLSESQIGRIVKRLRWRHVE